MHLPLFFLSVQPGSLWKAFFYFPWLERQYVQHATVFPPYLLVVKSRAGPLCLPIVFQHPCAAKGKGC